MKINSAMAITLVLAAATVWAQNTTPVTPQSDPVMSGRHPMSTRSMPYSATSKMGSGPTATTVRQREQDLEDTVNKMQAVLKQMHARAAASNSKDRVTKENLEMWDLMVGHLEKNLGELRLAMATQEDMAARRAALYKQAEARSAAAAEAARSAAAADAAQSAAAAEAMSAGQPAAAGTPDHNQVEPPAPTPPPSSN